MLRLSATRKKSILQTLRRWAVRLLLLMLVVAAIQALIFYFIAKHPFSPAMAELAVLFKGDEGRIAFFYQLVEEEKINRILIPGVSEKYLAAWSQKYKTPETSNLPATPATGSTFEDALMAARAIRRQGIHSVLLVTSDYHIPRSWFLLRALTLGQGISIHPVEVPSRMRRGGFWQQAQLIYNEMVNFWGSMTELLYFKATGGLLFENRRAIGVISVLKNALLFDAF